MDVALHNFDDILEYDDMVLFTLYIPFDPC
jgi:hypothetical protein